MIDMIIFNRDSYKGTPQEQLKKWSIDKDREDIISVTRNVDNGNITVFYFNYEGE